ncbi:hypothetical protein, partial [Streptomyces sp. AK04-3B]|uniref:hypothetical protein n=1 Tax=Streptomyces sp. AK04-3B TaxID=3028650 RepID=UPI0029B6C511
PRIPRTPGAALHTAAVRLRGTALAALVPPSVSRLVRRLVPRGGARRLWAEALHGRPALVLRVLGRRRGPRRAASRIPLFVAPPAPLTGPGDGALPR